jgi:hypothetical protein
MEGKLAANKEWVGKIFKVIEDKFETKFGLKEP